MVGAAPWDVHRSHQLPAVAPVSKFDAVQPFHDVHCLGAVRGEVEVVGKGDRDLAGRTAGVDVEHRQAARTLVVDVQSAHVPGRRDVVGNEADPVVVDDAEGGRIDHIHGSRNTVRHVHARRYLAQRAGHHTGKRVGVDVERGAGQARGLDVGLGEEAFGAHVQRARGRAGSDRRRRPDDGEHDGRRAQDAEKEDGREEDPEHPRPKGTTERAGRGLTRPEDLQVSGSARKPIDRRRAGG